MNPSLGDLSHHKKQPTMHLNHDFQRVQELNLCHVLPDRVQRNEYEFESILLS